MKNNCHYNILFDEHITIKDVAFYQILTYIIVYIDFITPYIQKHLNAINYLIKYI